MHPFSNNSLFPLIFPFFTLFLIIVPGIYEYITEGRKRRTKDKEQFDYKNNVIGEKELVLSGIAILKNYSGKIKTETEIKQRIETIEHEINDTGTGIVASHLPRFWKAKLDELQKIFHDVNVEQQKIMRRMKRRVLFGFLFLSACTYVFVGTSMLHLTSLNEIKVVVWLLFGIVFVLVMSLLSAIFMILFGKTFSALAPFAYYISRINQMCCTYAITKFLIYIYIAINILCFNLAYKFVYPSVTSVLSNVTTITLQIFTIVFIIVEIIVIVSGPIGTLDFFFDFFDERQQKKKK